MWEVLSTTGDRPAVLSSFVATIDPADRAQLRRMLQGRPDG